MNILIRKLIFNEAELHIVLWNNKSCFFVSELSKALDGASKDDIPVFLRNGSSAVKGIDYDVISGTEARSLKSDLENSGIKKRFSHTMIIYFSGLQKYFNYRKTIECKDFISYLEKCRINLSDDAAAEASRIEVSASPPMANGEAAVSMSAVSRKHNTVQSSSPSSRQSEFLKHLCFMEDFVESFNKLHIPSDKSVAFTKGIVELLESHGMRAEDLLKEIKKWIV